MAKLIQNEHTNTVKEDYNRYFLKLLIKYLARIIGAITIASIPFFVMYLLNTTDKTMAYLWLAAIAVFVIAGITVFRKYNMHGLRILKSGLVGEKRTVNLLKKLPYDNYILPDVRISSENIQADCVVISATGVYIIETKNHNGEIIILNKKSKIKHIKTTKSGNVYTNEIDNPIAQAERIADGIRYYLLKNGNIKARTQAIVYFSGKTTNVENRANFPVYSYKKRSALLKYILDSNTPIYTYEQMQKIAVLLRKTS